MIVEDELTNTPRELPISRGLLQIIKHSGFTDLSAMLILEAWKHGC